VIGHDLGASAHQGASRWPRPRLPIANLVVDIVVLGFTAWHRGRRGPLIVP
jgi:hypothetical protein